MNRETLNMQPRPLGKTGLRVTPLGFGAVKIGRNERVKYPQPFDLPDESTSERLLNSILDFGINYIDTAPAYGLSEERIGRYLAHRRHEFVLQTKIGETFADGESIHDYSAAALRRSLDCSLKRLRTDCLDVVLIHSDGRDLEIMHDTQAIAILQEFKQAGKTRVIGLSGKSVDGAEAAFDWADVLMVEFHQQNTSHTSVMRRAAERGIGIVVKKGLGSGYLAAESSIQFVLREPSVHSLIIGGLNLDHWRTNINAAAKQNVDPPNSL